MESPRYQPAITRQNRSAAKCWTRLRPCGPRSNAYPRKSRIFRSYFIDTKVRIRNIARWYRSNFQYFHVLARHVFDLLSINICTYLRCRHSVQTTSIPCSTNDLMKDASAFTTVQYIFFLRQSGGTTTMLCYMLHVSSKRCARFLPNSIFYLCFFYERHSNDPRPIPRTAAPARVFLFFPI